MTNLKPCLLLAMLLAGLHAGTAVATATPVTVDNFVHAESARFFGRTVDRGGFGKFVHNRDLVPIESQFVVRPNRDTLYSSAVFDLDAGPVSVTLPEAGGRYLSMIAIDENQYTPGVAYKPGRYTFSRKEIGTRYLLLGVRILVDPQKQEDMAEGHALQAAIQVSQPGGPGRYEMPEWDKSGQDRLRNALLELAETVPDSHGMFGTPKQVDPVRHLIGSASAWGGNPEKDAFYLNVTPPRNDGATRYRLKVGKVPVDAFWSISVYNAAGYYQRNPLDAYTINNLTAQKSDDGSVTIQFGGCESKTANCLPVTPGWNYMVRLYRPHAEILDGSWTFPQAQVVD